MQNLQNHTLVPLVLTTNQPTESLWFIRVLCDPVSSSRSPDRPWDISQSTLPYPASHVAHPRLSRSSSVKIAVRYWANWRWTTGVLGIPCFQTNPCVLFTCSSAFWASPILPHVPSMLTARSRHDTLLQKHSLMSKSHTAPHCSCRYHISKSSVVLVLVYVLHTYWIQSGFMWIWLFSGV